MGKYLSWGWPVALIIAGIVLLLDNFLLIDVDLKPYWPVLLVAAGVQVLLRGDIAPSWGSHTFGITRGSVQSATLEIESGEVDVQVRPLRKSGRLIAGQYTARSRPRLAVRSNHATLRMQRGQTWWLSLADWDVNLANDLPWDLLISSYLGQLEVDLDTLIIERAYVSSGLGSVRITCPYQATGTLAARSIFGDVHVSIPAGSRAVISVKTGPFGRVRLDSTRFERVEPGVYTTGTPQPDALDLDVVASTVFGTIYLS